MTVKHGVLWCSIMCLTGTQGIQAQSVTERLERARASMAAMETERAAEEYRAVVSSLPIDTPDSLRWRAHFELATVYVSLGMADSASTQFARAIVTDPFVQLEAERFNPDVERAFTSARENTTAIGLRVPQETVVNPAVESWPVDVAVGAPGVVTFQFRGVGLAAPQHSVSAPVERSGVVEVSLVADDTTTVPPGDYEVRAIVVTPSGRDSSSARVNITRLAVDTTAHLPPPDPSALRVETHKGPIAISSVASGLLVGAAASLIPVFIANPDLDAGTVTGASIGVGLSIGIAGLIGAVVGRPDVPITENIDYNRRLFADWETSNAAIISRNAASRRLAPLRIRAVLR